MLAERNIFYLAKKAKEIPFKKMCAYVDGSSSEDVYYFWEAISNWRNNREKPLNKLCPHCNNYMYFENIITDDYCIAGFHHQDKEIMWCCDLCNHTEEVK